MTLQIELDSAIEAQLTEAARKKGLDLSTYASEILKAAAPPAKEPTSAATVEEFRAMLDEFAKLGPKQLPFDDQNWSRDIIYGDHP